MDLPTLAHLRSYNTDHLTEAATHWEGAAARWRNTWLSVEQETHGLDWEGKAREAAVARVAADHTVVKANAGALERAAGIAREQAGTLNAMARSVTHLADEAQENGFTVSDDYEVDFPPTPDLATYIAKQTKAEEYSADLRYRAGNWAAHEHKTAADLIQAVGQHRTIHATPYPGDLMDRYRDDPLPDPPGKQSPGGAWHTHRTPYGDEFERQKILEPCEPTREGEDIAKATLGLAGVASGNLPLGVLGATMGVEGSLRDLFKCEPPEGVH